VLRNPKHCIIIILTVVNFFAYCYRANRGDRGGATLRPSLACDNDDDESSCNGSERRSARMSKITNDGLTRSGTGRSFITVPI